MPSTASPQTSAAKKLASPGIQTSEQTTTTTTTTKSTRDANDNVARNSNDRTQEAAIGAVAQVRQQQGVAVAGGQDEGEDRQLDWSSGRRSRDCSSRTTIALAETSQQQANRHFCPSTLDQTHIDSNSNNSSRVDGCEQQVAGAQVESDSDINNLGAAKKPLDQRIKVTLSAPSNSSAERQVEQPILLESSCDVSETQLPAVSGGKGAHHSIRSSGSIKGLNQRALDDETLASIRLERERELRKIAGQRANRLREEEEKAQQRFVVPTTSPSTASQLNNLAKKDCRQGKQSPPPVSNNQQQQQQQQLAICINGNIRSNSIFCQSSSSLSQSFNNILNRFQQSCSDSNQRKSSFKLKIDDKQSPLRLRHKHHKLNTSDKNSSVKVRCKKKNAEKEQQHQRSRAPNLVSNLRSGAENLFRDWHLLPETKGASKAKKCSLENGEQNTQQQKPILRRPLGEESGNSNSDNKQTDSSNSASSSVSLRDLDRLNSKEESYRDEQDCNSSGSVGSCEQATTLKPNYKLNPSSMFLRKAMRYYRLWIYCTNILILFGALIFILAAVYVTSDYRIKLLVGGDNQLEDEIHVYEREQVKSTGDVDKLRQDQSLSALTPQISTPTPTTTATLTANKKRPAKLYDIHISYSEPCVIIIYAVIAIQAGILQLFGCIGAIRMKEKWIQAYWYTILALCTLDLMLVIYWGYRYKFIITSLHHHMSIRLSQHYGHHFASNYSPITTTTTTTNISHLNNVAFSSQSVSTSMSSTTTDLLLTADSSSSRGPSSFNQIVDQTRIPLELSLKLDKILTDIIDKIQIDSQCCGISSSLDYKQSRWRRIKLEQLRLGLNWTQPDERDLLRRVPLVPASCCRANSPPRPGSAGRRPVILDDAQLVKAPRVPAWSPSMVVENLQVANNAAKRRKVKLEAAATSWQAGNESAAAGQTDDSDENDNDNDSGYGDDNNYADYDGQQGQYLAPDAIDPQQRQQQQQQQQQQRWLGGSAVQPDGWLEIRQRLSKQQRRLLSKQEHFNQPTPRGASQWAEPVEAPPQSRARRWSVESSVDERERVLSRIVADDEEPNMETGNVDRADSSKGDRRRLAALRKMLFATNDKRPADVDEIINDTSFDRAQFKWPNELQLSFSQYKIIEEYLLSKDQSDDDDDERDSSPPGNQQSRQKRDQAQAKRPQAVNEEESESNSQVEARRLRDKLVAAVRADREMSCAPRSYYDHATIYTRGCQTALENWVESSMNVLFVAGVCVLSFVKLCSLFMLRFEIREMIHKIRVLKGMATEYNALQDLEAYLPRPSVCAQAAELTPSGVTSALPPALNCSAGAGGSISGQSGAPPSLAPHRLGGSFSEAVVAATAAAAHTGRNSPTGRLALGGLASTGRAASMKAVAAMSCMLTPGLCPRSSSVSSAHLQAASWLSNIHQAGSGGRKLSALRSTDPFASTSPIVSRRHTAISVCPAAAANAAAVAAQHLMSRRGTYVANPLCTLGAPGMNLSQHRHSAHTVNASQLLLSPQQINLTAPRRTHCPHGDTPTSNHNHHHIRAASFEHQNSAESASSQQHKCQLMVRAAPTANNTAQAGHQQLLSLVYPFKRQSSGGAQSACNFSLDIAPPGGLLESRRSIH